MDRMTYNALNTSELTSFTLRRIDTSLFRHYHLPSPQCTETYEDTNSNNYLKIDKILKTYFNSSPRFSVSQLFYILRSNAQHYLLSLPTLSNSHLFPMDAHCLASYRKNQYLLKAETVCSLTSRPDSK